MRIRAAVVEARRGRLHLEDVDLDEPRENELLVQLQATGVCHADILARDGDLPFPLPGVLGHEGAGEIVEMGARVEELGHVVCGVMSSGDR